MDLEIDLLNNLITFSYDMDDYKIQILRNEDDCIINAENLSIPTAYSLKFNVNYFESILPNKILKSEELFKSNIMNLIKSGNMSFKVNETLDLVTLIFGCQVINDYNEVKLEIPITQDSMSPEKRLPKVVKVLKDLKKEMKCLIKENVDLKSSVNFHEEEISNLKQLILGISNQIEQNSNQILNIEDSLRSDIYMKMKEQNQGLIQIIDDKSRETDQKIKVLNDKSHKNYLKLKGRADDLMNKFNSIETKHSDADEFIRVSRDENTRISIPNESLNEVNIYD